MLQPQAQNRGLPERRRHIRYKAGDGALVIVPTASDPLYGFLLDISRSGISFEYIPVGAALSDTDELDILLEGAGVRFTKIPFRNVSDIEIEEKDYSPVVMRRRCVRFEKLTDDQLAGLEKFIGIAIRPGRR